MSATSKLAGSFPQERTELEFYIRWSNQDLDQVLDNQMTFSRLPPMLVLFLEFPLVRTRKVGFDVAELPSILNVSTSRLHAA